MTPHGTCRLIKGADLLIVTTNAKRGAKMVKNVRVYLVEDSRPDPRVANPAYSLTNLVSGDVWHVSVGDFGPACDCPHAEFRTNGSRCKHIAACQAVGLLPSESA